MHGSKQAGARMATAATAFLASLDPGQRATATAAFDTDDHRAWTYLPGPRPGLVLGDMTEAQRELAMELLATGLSEHGMSDARAIMALETILGDLERGDAQAHWERDPAAYWVRVLGDPEGDGPWAWRVNGHHLATHLTVVGDEIAATPQFFGANPAVVPGGPHAGRRVLPESEDLARALLDALDTDRRKVAVVDAVAPADILTVRDPIADPTRITPGLAHGDMTPAQQELLTGLVRYYLGRVTPGAGEAAWGQIVAAGLDPVTFTWAGSERAGRGQPHYYAVSGPTFVLEYDNTQNDANHIHSVWRDLRRDWGEDLLAAHYAAHHSS
jgi:Protein of unknown function (DUF3500)